MRRLFTAGKTLASDESGVFLVIMAVLVTVLCLLFAAVAEFGRVMIAREELQTGVDAAALAASYSGAKRMVEVKVITDRGERRRCHTVCDSEGNCRRRCRCKDCGTVSVTTTGEERELMDEGGWKDYCRSPCDPGRCSDGRCWHELKDRWVEFDQYHSSQAAEAFLMLNHPDQAHSAELTRSSPRLHGDRDSPFYPSVCVYAVARIRSLFPEFLGAFPEEYRVEVCGQGGMFYRTVGGEVSDVPEDACWKDL